MDVFYAVGDQQKGPVPLEELHGKLQRGELNQETLVFTEGMSDWLAFSAAVDLGKLPAVPPPAAQTSLRLTPQQSSTTDSASSTEPMVACPTCGARVHAGDLIPFQDRKVCPNCRDRVLQQVREGVGIQTAGTLKYAGFGPRLGSYIIDYIILQVYSQGLGFLFGLTGAMDTLESDIVDATFGFTFIIYMLLAFLGPVLYYLFTMGSPKHQATLGMKALKLKVVRSDGSLVSKWRIFGRYMASILSAMLLGIGYLMVLWDKEKATLHDRMADTRIVFQ